MGQLGTRFEWAKAAYIFICFVLIAVLSGCASAPSFQRFAGGDAVAQPGVSFVLPKSKSWSAIMRSTYQSAFGANEMPRNETLIVSTTVFNIPTNDSKQDFLAAVKKGRTQNEPQTGRFEVISNREELYGARPETCVVYQSAAKDFGVEAKRGGEYSIFETFGMDCIHPSKPSVGISVELSRKAPPGTTFPEFEAMASNLLQSVKFVAF